MAKLKKCPFCGGNGKIYSEELDIFGRIKKCYCVYCEKCCCATQYEDTEQEAIKDWNKRA